MLSSYGLQRASPDRVRGRVLSADFGLALAISSVSTLLAGYLAGTIGPLPTLYVMLAIMAATVGLWLLWTRPIRDGSVKLAPLPEQPTVVEVRS